MKTAILFVVVVVTSVVMVGCASTPNSLSGNGRTVVNDKGVVQSR